MQEEVWKDIPGYEGMYQVSNTGNVKSLLRYNKHRILSQFSSGRKYYSVVLFNNGKTNRFSVHQLVAMAFLNHKPNGNKLVIDHVDCDKLNNNLSNLRIVTHSENLTNIKRKKREPRILKKRVKEIS